MFPFYLIRHGKPLRQFCSLSSMNSACWWHLNLGKSEELALEPSTPIAPYSTSSCFLALSTPPWFLLFFPEHVKSLAPEKPSKRCCLNACKARSSLWVPTCSPAVLHGQKRDSSAFCFSVLGSWMAVCWGSRPGQLSVQYTEKLVSRAFLLLNALVGGIIASSFQLCQYNSTRVSLTHF